MTYKLKWCPACNGELEITTYAESAFNYWVVECAECKLQMGYGEAWRREKDYRKTDIYKAFLIEEIK